MFATHDAPRPGRLLNRREWLATAWAVCPRCRARNVQLRACVQPAEWRCRECRHEYEWEPPIGPRSPHAPRSATASADTRREWADAFAEW